MRRYRTTAIVGVALVLTACSQRRPDPGNGADSIAPLPGNDTAVVQPLPAPGRSDYPPCSATITDHCTQR